MNSLDVKSAVLSWLRFDRQLHYIATEVGGFAADCLGASLKKSIEVEVKITWTDFRNDAKKQKHDIYAKANPEGKYYANFVPNFFYYAVPPELKEKCLAHLEEIKSPYGLLVIEYQQYYLSPILFCKCVRKSKRLTSFPPTPEMLRVIVARMSSELASMATLSRGLREVADATGKLCREFSGVTQSGTASTDEEFETDGPQAVMNI